MNDRLHFEVKDNRGCFVFPERWTGQLLDEFEALIDEYYCEEISEQHYVSRLKRLIREEPECIDLYAHLAYALLEQDAPRKALNIALKGLAVANRLIPEGFSGEISGLNPENRPYLRGLHTAILASIDLRRHQEAVALTDKLLAYDPLDSLGAGWFLGSELLRSGDWDRASCVLEQYADEYSPCWYELGILYFMKGELVRAATALRRGFVANIYIAEILCGKIRPFPLVMWHDESGDTETAEEYYESYSSLWAQYPESLPFVNWLFNHSSVMSERAEIMKYAEMLVSEDEPEVWESLFARRETLLEKIDDRLSEEIVQKCKTWHGTVVWPWLLPFTGEMR
ncbi:tetratricopeptide repeat protein [Escherichia coli]|uniref:tetratricopeptide repeat protein n=2 Tax=Escherichia coli TaxID=562 RepID=UPI00164F18D5|nr:tetratricopeptide repeat protein [Escherichia coli]MBC6573245.1 tetratricopeptide repeat protein [Escherichia coli]